MVGIYRCFSVELDIVILMDGIGDDSKVSFTDDSIERIIESRL